MKLYDVQDNVLTLQLNSTIPKDILIIECVIDRPGCWNTLRLRNAPAHGIVIFKKEESEFKYLQYFIPRNFKEIITDLDLANFGFRRIGISVWERIDYREDADEDI